MKRRAARHVLVALLTAVGLATAGCGPADNAPDADAASPGTGFPVTVGKGATKVTVESRPAKVVSLSPTTTEMLFAIGAGEQVVAVDDQSNHPKDAPRTKLSGFKPNADAIAGYEPDLVVLSYDANNVVAGLRKLKVPVYVAPAAVTLDDTYRQFQDLGTLTGHADDAAGTVKQMRTDIDRLLRAVPKSDEPLTYYYEIDPQLHSATSKTFIGAVFELAGLRNIADEADKDGSGYPKLSAEYVLDADPDLVFLADTKCCAQTPEKLAERPGWDTLSAVQEGRVHALDDDVASRWGPRVVELVRVVADAVTRAQA